MELAPPDPLELATGATQVPSTPQEREHVLALLERARQNGDLHAPGSAPFSLKVTFNASGDVQQTGSGEMEETWFGPYSFRWTARLGDFSLDRISTGGQVFDDKPAAFIPIRLQMLRGAIFWPINFHEAHSLIRTATATWKGKEVTCVLVSGDMSDPTPSQGRRWAEREFCVENKTGMLQVLSEAPGFYVVYDYTDALKFHGRALPRQLSVVEGGKTVLEARIESVADALSSSGLLTPNEQMKGHARGPLLGGTLLLRRMMRVAQGTEAAQPVVVHAIVDRDGRVGEAELVASPDAGAGQSALDLVKRSVYREAERAWPGHQLEAFVYVQFIAP